MPASAVVNFRVRPDAPLARLAPALALAAAAMLAHHAHAHELSTGNHAESNPLHRAASAGNLDEVEHFLTEHGIHVNTPTALGRNTPLHYAVDHPSIVNRLIAAGANVNARDYSSSAQYGGETPLHKAARATGASHSPCLPAVVATLIAAGAEINAEDNAGQTPLYEALRRKYGVGCPDVAVALIEAGGDTSPFYSFTDGSGDFPRNDLSPLYLLTRWARGENELKPARALIRRGDDVNDGGFPTSSTPLYNALRWAKIGCRNCDPEISPHNWFGLVDLLVENGAHYGVPCAGELVTNPRPSTSLFYVSIENRETYACICPTATHTEVNGECQVNAVCAAPAARNETTTLCDCPSPNLGADSQAAPGNCLVPNAERCAMENPPLYYDAAMGACGARLYPCHETAIRLDDNSGCRCPAERPFSHGDPSGGSFDYFGDPDIPASAVCHAYSSHDPVRHSGDYSEWQDAVSANNPTLVAHFIRGHAADPDESGYYPLHEAAENDYHLSGQALIDGGANADRADDYGDAPLHRAMRNGRARMISILLDAGANPDLKDANDDAALHIASRLDDTAQNAGLISLLLKSGASPNLRNASDLPPLDIAFQGGRRGLMAALIDGGANWADPCTGGKAPNPHYRPADNTPQCVCPRRFAVDNNGVCECPASTHLTVNETCLARTDGAAVTMAVREMRAELAALRAELAAMNADLSAEFESPSLSRKALEALAGRATLTAGEISRRRSNLAALSLGNLGAAPAVALSDTATACRMLGGTVDWWGGGRGVCSDVDINDTFCLSGLRTAFSCVGLFRHVRRCNRHNRPALDPFHCAAVCAPGFQARGAGCAPD